MRAYGAAAGGAPAAQAAAALVCEIFDAYATRDLRRREAAIARRVDAALVAGGVYAGPFEALQELEDEGDFDAIVANAPPGDGYWALPEEWGVASNMLAGGGITLLNDVPAL